MLVDIHSVNMASVDTCSRTNVVFSECYTSLTGSAKTRYHEKVFTCGFHPYMLKKSECSEHLADYLSVEYPDIGNHRIYSATSRDPKLLTQNINLIDMN